MDPRPGPFLRFLAQASVHLEDVRDADRAARVALRLARDAFAADEACLAVLERGSQDPRTYAAIPQSAGWDLALVARFLRGERPRLSNELLLAGIERRGRPWGALVLRWKGRGFEGEAVRDIVRVATVLSRALDRADRTRIAEVREKVDRKVMEQIRPKDLFYQVLHGLRSLTEYDHSAAILTGARDGSVLEVVAEQIAWHKGKSARIGARLPLTAELRGLIEGGGVMGFDRAQSRWREWQGREASILAEVLDYSRGRDREDSQHAEMSILAAPFATRGGDLGVVKIASRHPGSLGAFEADLVRRFLPHAAVAIHNMQRTASIERGLLEAERKSFLANLARGVSHDVNNAFGAVLPLVQQLRSEVEAERIDVQVFAQDLTQIEHSLQVCRRIFGGMLAFARGGAREVGTGDVLRAIDSTLAVLEESMRRQSIRIDQRLEDQLPLVRGAQGDIEQLILNLASNARDAMQGGGQLCIEAGLRESHVQIVIRDTGSGIAPDDMERIQEPFFSTKPHGNGLGLSICRSIVWKMQGRMHIESQLGEGTRVEVFLPLTTGGPEEPQP